MSVFWGGRCPQTYCVVDDGLCLGGNSGSPQASGEISRLGLYVCESVVEKETCLQNLYLLFVRDDGLQI